MRFQKLSVLLICLGIARGATAQICDPPSQCSADWVSGCSPIVINFENGSYRLTGANDPVMFDISGTGHPVRIGWTKPGADEAFLALDRDHDEKITSGVELFGTTTPLADGSSAGNGFKALAQYDDNHDGVIDEQDAIWFQLLLWRDLNHDGISQPSELTPVAMSSLKSISLDYHWTGRRDQWGNGFKYESTVSIAKERAVTSRPVYDIFFVPVPSPATLLAQSSQQVKQAADAAVELREARGRLAAEPPDVAREYEHLASEPFESRRHLFGLLPSSMKSAVWVHHLLRAVTTHPEFTAEQRSVIYDAIRLAAPAHYEADPATVRKDLDDLTLRAQRLFSGDVVLHLFLEIGSDIPSPTAPEPRVEPNGAGANRTEGDQRALPNREAKLRPPARATGWDCDCSLWSTIDWCALRNGANWDCHSSMCDLKSFGCGALLMDYCDGTCVYTQPT
ncbi:MAG TPA: bacteriocin fulvocin C-related protein [Thermoanaerobaculia bacterium]|nr:bacteriocin fulvocin C-related protein [Thermoanaerobaculia bacterium]